MAVTIYYPGCEEDDLPEYIPDICPDDEDPEHARARSVAFIHKSYKATLAASPVAATWKTGIEAGKIRVIPKVSGAYDGGAAVTGPGYGNQSEKITGFNCSLTFKDPTFKRNAAFYNAILKSSNYHVAWCTETQTEMSENPVTVIPKNAFTDSLTDERVFDVECKWSQPLMTVPFDTPVGIFDPVFAVE